MKSPGTNTLLGSALTTALLGTALVAPVGANAAGDAAARLPARQVNYVQWSTTDELATGHLDGLRASKGRLRMDFSSGREWHVDPRTGARSTYDSGRWTSQWTEPGFGLTELVPSWDATTPGDSWVKLEIRGESADGQLSSWDSMGNWSREDDTFRRTSLGSQTDDLGRVATDTWQSNSATGLTSWQLRVTMLRATGSTVMPTVDTLGVMASRLPDASTVATSRPGVARGITLNVPEYSQMTHRGHYPKYGNGGEAWCSPTSTSMVLGFYDRLPERDEYSWVSGSNDRFVDHAARMTYDYAYEGTGNWPFNTAYAATYVRNAFVTRLRSLREAERFIEAGIPVVASIAFGRGELTGSPISSTVGHVVVIVGFAGNGDVVVNDPAAPTNSSVRRTYKRGQFENAWLPKSGGLVYIIRTQAQDLPERDLPHNW